jgi:tRNA nucleotidyltransferase/poly(A) polymerase
MSLLDVLLRSFPALERIPPGNYVVGGAIRDLIRGAQPLDVDIASPDPLPTARLIASRVIRLGTGDHLSAWRVVGGEHVYDVAQILDGSIAADLARRDFTVNAMAVDLGSGELLDLHGGQRDLRSRLVRMIDASNFDDDPLRMLKAVRMAVVLRFAIDEPTMEAIRVRAESLVKVAAERVAYELQVIFSAGAFRTAVGLLHRTGLDAVLFGRLLDAAAYHADDLTLAASYVLLVRDPREFARRWRWSANLLHEVTTLQSLIDHHDAIALYDAGASIAAQLPALLRAIGKELAVPTRDLFAIRPLLTGEDISEMTGIPPGPELGARKRSLLEAQIRGEVRTRAEAERFVRERASRAALPR